jgi:hypothetical protein
MQRASAFQRDTASRKAPARPLLPLIFAIVSSRKGRSSARIGRRLCTTRSDALGGRFAFDVRLDHKQPCDHFERLRRRWRFLLDMDVVDFAARMRPTGELRQRGGRAR